MNIPSLGGRRFLLTVGCGAVNAVLLWFAKLDAGSYTTLTLGTVAVYIAGNTYQKREQIRSGQPETPQ